MAIISVIIAESHPIFRMGYISYLQSSEQLEVIGEAGNSQELLHLLEKKIPDVLLLDSQLPELGGLAVLKQLQTSGSPIKTILLCRRDDLPYMPKFIAAGGRSILHKKLLPETLLNAIYTVHKEGFYLNHDGMKGIADALVLDERKLQQTEDLRLSKREIEILEMICDGKTNRQIAKQLEITTSTIDFHRQNLYRKTNSNSLVGLVKYAIKYEFVLLD